MPTHSTIDPFEAAAKSLGALLTSIERPPSPAAVIAFKAAITRHGRNLHTERGPEALAAVLVKVRQDAADNAEAEERERIVMEAWQGIAGPHDAAA